MLFCPYCYNRPLHRSLMYFAFWSLLRASFYSSCFFSHVSLRFCESSGILSSCKCRYNWSRLFKSFFVASLTIVFHLAEQQPFALAALLYVSTLRRHYRLAVFVKQRCESCRISVSVEYILYAGFGIHPDLNHVDSSLLINLFKAFHNLPPFFTKFVCQLYKSHPVSIFSYPLFLSCPK